MGWDDNVQSSMGRDCLSTYFTHAQTCDSVRVQSPTSSTAQGGGGSFKNRKRIGEIDCCE